MQALSSNSQRYDSLKEGVGGRLNIRPRPGFCEPSSPIIAAPKCAYLTASMIVSFSLSHNRGADPTYVVFLFPTPNFVVPNVTK